MPTGVQSTVRSAPRAPRNTSRVASWTHFFLLASARAVRLRLARRDHNARHRPDRQRQGAHREHGHGGYDPGPGARRVPHRAASRTVRGHGQLQGHDLAHRGLQSPHDQAQRHGPRDGRRDGRRWPRVLLPPDLRTQEPQRLKPGHHQPAHHGHVRSARRELRRHRHGWMRNRLPEPRGLEPILLHPQGQTGSGRYVRRALPGSAGHAAGHAHAAASRHAPQSPRRGLWPGQRGQDHGRQRHPLPAQRPAPGRLVTGLPTGGTQRTFPQKNTRPPARHVIKESTPGSLRTHPRAAFREFLIGKLCFYWLNSFVHTLCTGDVLTADPGWYNIKVCVGAHQI